MNHAYYFEKVIGRTLTPRERDVISPLEYVRQHTDRTRIGIIDPPGCDSRQILIDYVIFLHTKINPRIRVLVMAPTRCEARAFTARFPRQSSDCPWYFTAGGTNPNGPRGLNYDVALLLDADGYIYRTIPVVSPVIGDTPGNHLLIAHSRTALLSLPPAYWINPEVPVPPPRKPHTSPAVLIISTGPSPTPPAAAPPQPLLLPSDITLVPGPPRSI